MVLFEYFIAHVIKALDCGTVRKASFACNYVGNDKLCSIHSSIDFLSHARSPKDDFVEIARKIDYCACVIGVEVVHEVVESSANTSSH